MRTIDAHGTHTHRRNKAPGNSPVERRRVRVPVGSSRECRQVRRSFVAALLYPRTPSCAATLWARASGGAAVSNTDGWGFDTFRACSYALDLWSSGAHFDNCRASSRGHLTMAPHGSVAPWRRRLAVNQSSFRHRGFNSSPTHTRASRPTGGAPGSYPGTDWVRAPGCAPRRRNSEVRVTACRAEGRGFNSRRWRRSNVDVAQWTGRRPTKPEVEGSTPSVGTNTSSP